MEPLLKIVTTDDPRPTLKEMQEFVDGRIEIVYSDMGDFVINEEGLLDGLPVNLDATDMLWHCTKGKLGSDEMHHQLPVLVGNVMLVLGGLD